MMMIDADAMKEWLDEYLSVFKKYDKSEVKGFVEHQPSIDIVRCKECKYWHKNRKEGDGMNVFDVCYDFQADDFCSYGERKGECKECWHWSEVHKRCENKCGCQFKPYGEREGE